MSDPSPASALLTSDELRNLFAPDELLQGLFDTSLAGLVLYRPVHGTSGEIVDFAFVLLNAAAQRMLDLPARPTDPTFLSRFPDTLTNDVYACLCRVVESGRPEQLEVGHQADGLDSHYHISARRVGAFLLVSFTDSTQHPRTSVENALRKSQAREQAARAEAETERQRLHGLLMQAPAMIAILEGPSHVFRLVNPSYQQLVGSRQLLGRPIHEAMPELEGQPIFGLLDDVYRTGETFRATEMLVQLDHDNSGRLGQRYYNFVYQSIRNAAGVIDGILVFAYDVTDQVRARSQIELAKQELELVNYQLAVANEELAATNEEMTATNEELHQVNAETLTNNQALQMTQRHLQQLNQELEIRVLDRTRELQRALREAQLQRERLRSFLLEIPAPVAVLRGPMHVFELANAHFQRMLGGRSLEGLALRQAMPELAGQGYYELLDRLYRTGLPFTAKETLAWLTSPEGQPQESYFDIVLQPTRDEHEDINGILMYSQDVTEHVLARRRLEQREQEFRTLTNAIPHLVWTATPAGELDYHNERWFAYTGQNPASVTGSSWAEVIHPNDLPLLQQRWTEAVLRNDSFQAEARLRGANGAYRWFLIHALAMHNEHGAVVKWFGTSTDVHQQKGLAEALKLASQKLANTNRELRAANEKAQAANAELALTNEQLLRINQDLDNFVYTASHDLKQPVNNMAGVFEELKRTATFHDPEAELLMGMFENALSQIHHTIHGLSQVVQAERQTQQFPSEVVVLRPLAEGVVQSMHSQAETQKAEFELDFEAVPAVHFTRLNLQSILYNLLSNALKYAHPDRRPRVRVSSERGPGGSAIITVQDNGLGLDMSRYGADLFQMFRRFHNHVEGSGMGLYLVNRIVQQAGGHVEVTSTVGEGTTFRLHLPDRPAPMQVAE